jgi:type II secretory pathway pseudopilin PulG
MNRPVASSEPEPERTPRRRERRQQLSSVQIVLVSILSIGMLLVINLTGRIARGQQMEAARRRLQATIDVLETQKLDLLEQRNYATHDASVEHWAHTEGKMVREGEILVIPIPAGSNEATPAAPTPASVTPPEAEPEPPKWHLWWSLFFDGEPPF